MGKDDWEKSSDLLLWKEFTKDIVPFHENAYGKADATEKTGKASADRKKRVVAEEPVYDTGKNKPFRFVENPQIDRRTEEKLRRGKMPIEGRLDLHGMNRLQAERALNSFVETSFSNGKRCVLIITGKGKAKLGKNSPISPARGILKECVPQWLSAKPLSNMVLKYVIAKPKDGGEGALYVYLRRKR